MRPFRPQGLQQPKEHKDTMKHRVFHRNSCPVAEEHDHNAFSGMLMSPTAADDIIRRQNARDEALRRQTAGPQGTQSSAHPSTRQTSGAQQSIHSAPGGASTSMPTQIGMMDDNALQELSVLYMSWYCKTRAYL